MNGALNKLYGFDSFGFGTDGAAFGFERDPAPWIWVIIACVAIGLAALVYTRSSARPIARWAAGGCRAALLIALAVLSFGPRLEKPRTRIVEDRVLYLLDRSESMTINDGGGLTREDQLNALLAGNAETLGAVDRSKTARWYGFGRSVTELTTDADGIPSPGVPGASATQIGRALNEAIADNTGQPISAIVLLSDGRSTDPVSRATRAMLSKSGVPVFAVPLGSADRAPDIALESVEAPAVAYVNDTVPVTVTLNVATGSETGREQGSTRGSIEILDTATGLVIESAPVTPADFERGSVTVPVRLETPGESRWTVRVVPDGPDLSPSNNETTVSVRFVDDPIRVLYVDGSPRWEQRYLKTMLLREDSIDASCLLIAADRRFQQEGNTLLASLPADDDEWDEFDLIILGDIAPELLGERATTALRTQIGDRSTGLLWLAGPSATPHAWGDSPAGDVLPLRVGSSASVPTTWDRPVTFRTTPASDRLGLFGELQDIGGITRDDSGWSRLRWALRLGPESVKPSAEVFAVAATDEGVSQSPLVVAMRYGAGRTAIVTTDEIWRWRYGRGEESTERFWLPLVRHLARPRLASIGTGARLEVSSTVVPAGQQVVVELVVTDRATAEILPERLVAQARPLTQTRAEPTPIALIRDGVAAGVARYRGAFTPLRTGQQTIGFPSESLLPEALSRRIDVISDNNELFAPQTDHALLASIASESGGRTLTPEEFGDLPKVLPNRRVIAPLPPETRTLWDHPAPLAVLLVLASAEWIIRRKSRLA